MFSVKDLEGLGRRYNKGPAQSGAQLRITPLSRLVMPSSKFTSMESVSTQDRSKILIGIIVMLQVITTLVVALRLWTRHVILNQLGPDDYLALISLLSVIGCGVAMILGTRYGLGKHLSPEILETAPFYFKDFYVVVAMYLTSLLFIKLAFLLHYYRLLAVQGLRRVYQAAIFIVGGWSVSQIFVGIFICWPIRGFWDKTIDAECIPNQPQWYINAAGNIISDLIVLLLPLPVIKSLRLPRAQKFILAGIFSLGFFTVILSAIRIKYLKDFEDFPWEHVESHLWSMAELSSGLICACLPTLRPFILRYFPALSSKFTRSSGNHRGNHGSRIHSAPCRPSKSAGRGADELLHSNAEVFEMQHHCSDDGTEYSRHQSDEDLVIRWTANLISAAAAESSPVRPVPIRGIHIETNTFRTITQKDAERGL